jgi:hypothetical protein
MHRRMIAPLLMAFSVPMVAQANVLSLQGDGTLLPETAGQQLVLLISGTDFYSDSELFFTINGGVGPAPAVTHVFGDPQGAIPTANLAGSVWANGAAGIAQDPGGTTSSGSGLLTHSAYTTPGFVSKNTAGIYVVLTITTVGVPAGDYPVSLAGTVLNNGLDEFTFEVIPAPLELPDITLTVVPEPSACVMAAAGAVALLFFSCRRRMG